MVINTSTSKGVSYIYEDTCLYKSKTETCVSWLSSLLIVNSFKQVYILSNLMFSSFLASFCALHTVPFTDTVHFYSPNRMWGGEKKRRQILKALSVEDTLHLAASWLDLPSWFWHPFLDSVLHYQVKQTLQMVPQTQLVHRFIWYTEVCTAAG